MNNSRIVQINRTRDPETMFGQGLSFSLNGIIYNDPNHPMDGRLAQLRSENGKYLQAYFVPRNSYIPIFGAKLSAGDISGYMTFEGEFLVEGKMVIGKIICDIILQNDEYFSTMVKTVYSSNDKNIPINGIFFGRFIDGITIRNINSDPSILSFMRGKFELFLSPVFKK